jgi:hypothetical protein
MFLERWAPALTRLPAGSTADQAPARLDLAGLVGSDGWRRLPAAVRRRFGAAGHARVVYEGRMDLQCSVLGRWFAWAGRLLGGPLTAERAGAVPTRVRVQDDGRGGVVWERQFIGLGGVPHRAGSADRGAQAARVVRSTKCRARDGGLVERTDGGLAMRLAVFEQAGSLVFESRRYFLDLGGWALPLPAWCTPGVCRVEHQDLGAGRFRFLMTMRHAWWGETFRQCGEFVDPAGDRA